MAGFLQIAPAPKTLTFAISLSQEEIELPSLTKTLISE